MAYSTAELTSARLLWLPLLEGSEMQHALQADSYGAVHTGEVLASPEASVR
jgi:hypothetical protein